MQMCGLLWFMSAPADQQQQLARIEVIALARRLAQDGTAKQLRLAAGLTLRDAAQAVGCDATTIWHWEKGDRPKASSAERYGAFLARLIAPSDGEAKT